MHPTAPKLLRAYGDRQGDGMVQMSFVLEVAPSAKAREAAKRFAEQHGLKEALVSTMEPCAEGYTYFVVYGHSERAVALHADAILVSQIITQRNCHKENAAALIELATAQGWRSKVVMLLGGPRIDHKLALELGFDAGFGPGTKPGDVASFLVEWL